MQRMVHYSLLTILVLPAGVCSADVLVPGGPACGECCGAGCGQGCNVEGCDGQNEAYQLSRRQQRRLNRQCPPVVQWRAMGIDWAHNCGPVGKAARCGVPGAACLQHCMQTKAAPDAGWSPPCRIPVNRNQTGFSSYTNFGNSYAAAPMVFQPTDTAQLGYSYAHVPTWQRNPRMIPPTPNPSAFHARFCPRGPACHDCFSGGSYCSSGHCVSTGHCDTCQGSVIDTYHGGSFCPTGNCHAAATPSVERFYTVEAPASQQQEYVASAPAARQNSPATNIVAVSNSAPVQEVSVPQRTIARPAALPQRVKSQRVQRSAKQKSSGGWFGLPSLAEIKF